MTIGDIAGEDDCRVKCVRSALITGLLQKKAEFLVSCSNAPARILDTHTNIVLSPKCRTVRLDSWVPQVKVVQRDLVCLCEGPATVSRLDFVELLAVIDHARLSRRRRR
jgi:hypothetical protein